MGARVCAGTLVRSITTRRRLRVLWGSLICDLCHKTTLVVGTVGDSLNTAVRQVHLVAALHLAQVILGLSLGKGVPTVVVLHPVLVLEWLRWQFFDGGWTISSLPLFQGLLLFPINRGLLSRGSSWPFPPC